MAVVMEEEAPALPATGFARLTQTPGARTALLMAGVAAVVAIMAGIWLWGQKPEYRVLFSNFSDRDGGSIVASLQQMNVPYKYSDGGNAILVPEDKVHDIRLKLAAQGLPKGGNVGFELMENQKLGISQFLEQVNFQRALEGELARSIQSVSAVESARVHLALPKSSVFVRDQQKPTASVLLQLHPGRNLDEQQVSAIVHLVASSVPELPTKNVTVVDQSGNLLSENGKKPANGLDPSQLKYIQELQQNIVRRVESIITPIVGENNVRAEATADVDFSTTEQAAEVYKPNQEQNAAAIRSQHNSESQNGTQNASGVPGSLSNQPPVPATAPLTTPQVGQNANAASSSKQRDTTTNYEVDKTIRYVQQPMGGIKRLSVAVVVNYKRIVDKNGKLTSRPLTEAEKTEITNLVREAMGFNKDRGDSVNVVNSPFAGMEKDLTPEVPFWKRRETFELAKEAGRYLFIGLILLFIYFRLLKPLLNKLLNKEEPVKEEEEVEEEAEALLGPDGEPIILADGTVATSANAEAAIIAMHQPTQFDKNLEAARLMSLQNPKAVANVIKGWVASNE